MGGGGPAVWLPHSLPPQIPPLQGSHPYAILPPHVHQRGGTWGGHQVLGGPGCGGACSTSLPRLLQLPVRGLEDLGVVETSHRSLDSQSLHGRVSLPDGDHPVCAPVCPSGRLDGLHRPQGSLPPDSCPSGVSPLPSFCATWPSVPVHCALFRPLHSSAGLLPGHGSCFCHSPFLGYPHEAVPLRLARPVVLPRLSPTGPSGSVGPLSRAGHRSQPEVTPRPISGGSVSLGSDRRPVFQGFSVAGSHRQAAINRWRISVLRRSSSQYLALAAGDAVLTFPPCSGRPYQDEVSPAMSSPLLGSCGSVHPDPLVSGLSSRSPVVAPLVSSPGVSGSGLLVRRLGRRLGGSLRDAHHFRPLEPRRKPPLYKRQGASGRTQGSSPPPVFSGGENNLRLLRQLHVGVLPPQGGGHEVSIPQLAGTGDPPVGRIPLHPPGSPVHSEVSECSRGHSVAPSPTAPYRVVPQSGGLLTFKSSVAGLSRLVCYLRKSPMLDLFLSLPGSDGCRHECVPPTMGRSSSLHVSSMVHYSQGAGEAPGISGDGAHVGDSVLASATLVSRPPSPVAGPSGGSASTSRPPAPASISQSLPGSPQAAPSCLETLQCFTRADGFSFAVAFQASLSRRPSSRKAYQLKWQVCRSWCHPHGHSCLSPPSLAKAADFLCWLQTAKGLSVFSIRGYRSMLSTVFRFHLPSLSSHPVIRDLLRSFCLSVADRQLRPPAWDLSVVLRFLNTSAFEPLSAAPLRALTQKVLFLLALATAKRVGELQALSAVVTFVRGDACLSYIPQFVAKSESLTCSIPRSFLVKSLSDFAAGLDEDLLLCPVRALRIYLDRTNSLAPLRHRIFVSPRCPSRPLSKNAVSFFLRELISAAGASRPEVGRVRAHEVCGVSASVAFHRNWSVSAVLEAATWSSSSVFSSFYNTNMMAFYLWVRLCLRARGSDSPHLFLACSGGGGGPVPSLSPLLLGPFTCCSGWMQGLPIQ